MVKDFNTLNASPESPANEWEITVNDLSKPEQTPDTPEAVEGVTPEDSKETSVAEALEDVHEAFESEADNEKEAGIVAGDQFFESIVNRRGIESDEAAVYLSGKLNFLKTRFNELVPEGMTKSVLHKAIVARARGETTEHDQFVDMILQNAEVN